MLPKAHLISHSRMSGSRWVITPLWLSGSWWSLLYSSVYSCHLFLISSASVRSTPFLSFIVPIFAWKFPLVFLIFLTRSLVHSIVSLYFFALITEEGFLISPVHWNGYICPFLPCLLHLFFSQLFVRSSQKPFCLFAFVFPWMVLITASCTMSWTSIHSSSGTLSDLIPWIYLSLPLYNQPQGIWFRSYLNGLVVFPTFFNLSLNST